MQAITNNAVGILLLYVTDRNLTEKH